MANLDSLDYKSILDMDNDEGIETLRQIRLSRRVVKKTTTHKPKVTKAPSVSANEAAELLKILGGE